MTFERIPHREKADIAKNLAMMLKSGVPINEAFASLGDQAHAWTSRGILQQIRKDIEAGTSLSAAFERHGTLFGSVFVSLIRTGEKSGTLDENLQYLAEWLEREYTLRQEMNSATIYPKIVITVALLIGGLLTIYVLPRLQPLFTGLNVDLPLVTRVLLVISVWIQEHWLYALLTTIGTLTGLFFITRLLAVRRILHYIVISLPVFGTMIKHYQLAIINQLMFTMTKSGVPIQVTLQTAGNGTSNIAYREAFLNIQQRVTKGTKISQALKSYERLFPRHMVTMVAVGEKSGTLNIVFGSLAEYYTNEVMITSKKLPTILEPILLVIIALAVAFIAIAVILPIYTLTQGLTQ